MEFWLDKNKCTGCAACANACPRKAIEMVKDELGFYYPKFLPNCVNCGICKRVCDGRLENGIKSSSLPRVFAAWSNDRQIRFNSTSGGIFSEIAKNVLSEGGKAFGAMFNKDMHLLHSSINTFDEIDKIRQSKYLQSDISFSFFETKKALQEGIKVLFCGSPCQIAGLYSFLGQKYDNLITVDFVCRGVNSPKAFSSWMKEIEENENKKIKRVWFKYKVDGWGKSPRCTKVIFDDNSSKVFKGKDNKYMSAYLGPNLFIRPSCGDCDFKGFPRLADITVGDFWKIDSTLDDDLGTSLVLINTTKGESVFNGIKESIHFYEKDFNSIFEGNVCINDSVHINPKSALFLKSLDKIPFSKAYKKYGKSSFFQRAVRKITKVFK